MLHLNGDMFALFHSAPSKCRYSTPGGYSAKAVHPIALGKVMQIAKMMKAEFDGEQSLSAIGGVETGGDSAEFILLGANTVQVKLLIFARMAC